MQVTSQPNKQKNYKSENSYRYESPLVQRYASNQMIGNFCQQKRYAIWRHLWIILAQAQKDLDLPIGQDQIDQMKAHSNTIDFDRVAHYEKKLRHDVMAHIHAFGDQCPKARSIIHLGATSCLITDNADIILMRDGLQLVNQKLIQLIHQLAVLADTYKNLPCLSFTHLQPAQPTTVGKRFCMWLQDFLLDFFDLEYRLKNLSLLGIKGATGTQASFLKLFDGDHGKVLQLEKLIAKRLGFDQIVAISGQTYSRKQDVHILNLLSGIAISAHKMSTDLRLLANMKEVEEPFNEKQIGSSAMPYKRNPMQNERVCSLARYIMSLGQNPMYTAATQWMERTLDDSANRRLCIPEAFLATDAILNLLINISQNLVVYPKIIEKNLQRELPFIATENILMACVKKGANRQTMHEYLREHSITMSDKIKHEGTENNLIERLAADPKIPLTKDEFNEILKIKHFIGRAPQQVSEFLKNKIYPLLKKHKSNEKITINIKC